MASRLIRSLSIQEDSAYYSGFNQTEKSLGEKREDLFSKINESISRSLSDPEKILDLSSRFCQILEPQRFVDATSIPSYSEKRESTRKENQVDPEALIDAPLPSDEKLTQKVEEFKNFETSQKIHYHLAPLRFYKEAKLRELPPLTQEYIEASFKGNVSLEPFPFGYGTFADVHEAYVNNNLFAFKLFQRHGSKSHDEVRIAQQFKDNSYILQPLVAFDNAILYKRAWGSFDAYITSLRDRDFVSEKSAKKFKKILLDVAKGFALLQEKGYLHRDLKAHNILLFLDPKTNDFNAKIGDLDTTVDLKNYEEQAQFPLLTGTPIFMSPELASTADSVALEDSSRLKNADVYSFGLIIFDALRKEKIESPFTSASNKKGKHPDTSKKIVLDRQNAKDFMREDLPKLLNPRLKKEMDPTNVLEMILLASLRKDPEKRISFQQIASLLEVDLSSSEA